MTNDTPAILPSDLEITSPPPASDISVPHSPRRKRRWLVVLVVALVGGIAGATTWFVMRPGSEARNLRLVLIDATKNNPLPGDLRVSIGPNDKTMIPDFHDDRAELLINDSALPDEEVEVSAQVPEKVELIIVLPAKLESGEVLAVLTIADGSVALEIDSETKRTERRDPYKELLVEAKAELVRVKRLISHAERMETQASDAYFAIWGDSDTAALDDISDGIEDNVLPPIERAQSYLKYETSDVKKVQKLIDLKYLCLQKTEDAYFANMRHWDSAGSLFDTAESACNKARVAVRNLGQDYTQALAAYGKDATTT